MSGELIASNELTGSDELAAKVARCNRCGFCQEVCPTYQATGEEFSVARGRIHLTRLALQGGIRMEAEPELARHLNSCLLCKACVSACPSGVVTDEIVSAMRAKYGRLQKLSLPKQLVYRRLFPSNRNLRRVGRILRFYQKSGLRWVVKGTGILSLFGSLGKAEGLLPAVPARTFREQLRREDTSERFSEEPVRQVAYFLGCAINNFYPEVGMATVRVLGVNSCRVSVPENVCCGAPHQSLGDLVEARRLARLNIDAFAGFKAEAIVTECATCGSVLREYGMLLADDPEYAARAAEFSKKVVDINEYLVAIGFKKQSGRELGEVRQTVSYHDPCHLSRGQKVREAPRAILKSIPGLELREMEEADWCCGGAGSFCVTHHELSMKILDRKMNNFRKTGAQLLATSCPACTMQLSLGIRRQGLPAKVVHPVQLLDQAYRAI